MNIPEELGHLGLSEKEAKVYVGLLELVQANVQAIAKKAGVNRPTAYVVLDSLVKKGLCSTFEKDKKAFYLAENPENLELFLDLQERELHERREHLDKVLGDLKTIYSLQGDERPFVKFFEGKEGLLAARNESYAKSGDTVRTLYPLEGFQDFYSEAERKVGHEERNAKDIFAKVLYTADAGEIAPDKSRDTLKIASEKYPLAADVSLFGDSKVRITSLSSKLSGVMLDDPEIYKTFVSLFELAWLGAQSLQGEPNQ